SRSARRRNCRCPASSLRSSRRCSTRPCSEAPRSDRGRLPGRCRDRGVSHVRPLHAHRPGLHDRRLRESAALEVRRARGRSRCPARPHHIRRVDRRLASAWRGGGAGRRAHRVHRSRVQRLSPLGAARPNRRHLPVVSRERPHDRRRCDVVRGEDADREPEYMNRRGALLFAAMCVIWGVPYLMIRVAVRELAPVTLVFLRTGIGALLLTPFAALRGDLRPALARWWPLLAYTVVEVAIPWVLLARAETKLSSSLTGLLIAAVPLVGAVVVGLTGARERQGTRRWAGLLVGMLGVAA